jgi:hypothetical protein
VVVHSAVVAATSEHFNALINGGMDEAQRKCARFENVKIDDFARFCEFAYRGDYKVPTWDMDPQDPCDIVPEAPKKKKKSKKESRRSDLPVPPPPPPPEEEPLSVPSPDSDTSTWGSWGRSRHRATGFGNEFAEPELAPAPALEDSLVPEPELPTPEPAYDQKQTSKTRLRTQFNNRNYLPGSYPKSQILHTFEPLSNSAAEQNFTPIFLAHARLYSFAHLRLVTPLKALTLDKLHKTLIGFKLYHNRIGDIIELVRYAYSDDDLPNRSDDGVVDELRKLVVEYVVCEIDTIGEHDEFIKLMEEGGEFVGDFWRLARDNMR